MAKKGLIQRHHAFHGVVMICGWLLPPLAVLIRFGVGLDFVINVFCTICGYIPGHVHNFWIQNIRNNKNARHSPSWAIRYGLVKDYRSKRTQNGWSDRYGESGNDFNNQDIIVDPVTGETRKDPDALKRGNVRAGSHFLSPWADNVEDSPRAEREDPYGDERRPSERQGGRVERDPVTGAILSGGQTSPGRESLSRTSSRRSLGNRYAERYGLGGDSSSANTSSYSHDNNNTTSSKWGRSKPKKKDRWAREAEVLGTPANQPYGSDSYSFDNGDNYNRSSNNNRNSSIKDPLSDRHDF